MNFKQLIINKLAFIKLSEINCLIIIFLFLLIISCKEKRPLSIKPIYNEIPNNWAIKDSNFIHFNGQLIKNNQPFSGYLIDLFANKDTALIAPYFNGKEEGFVKTFYPNKQLATLRYYELGKKEGEHRGYWEKGQLKFVFNFKNDVHQGNAKEWMLNGQLYRDFNYLNGQESGMQKIYYSNGKIAANYEAKNGRNYGLTGVKNCVSVGDSLRRH